MADAYWALPAAGPATRDSRRPFAISLLHDIPPTSAERLTAPDAHADDLFAAPSILSDATNSRDDVDSKQPATVLYLAYGSNLCAETFLGVRGIRPLSQINVSAPSLRLTFDLPGLPYNEPCFANVALRKIPKPPMPVPSPPIPVPNPPNVPSTPPSYNPPQERHEAHSESGSEEGFRRNLAGDPVWKNGLIGVVYEVTRSDYAHIVATEGGGASYQEIAVPCIPLLPPRVGVPEKPLPPVVPRPFLARTLLAPRLPADLPDEGDNGDGDDGGDDKEPKLKLPRWARRMLLPARRPEEDYAQPSERYMKLIRDGAAEHDLPGEYQTYLNALQAYEAITWRQKVGRYLYLGLIGPMFLLMMIFGKKVADENGRLPAWMTMMTTVLFNLVWLSYDAFVKKLCGDGERTVDGDGECAGVRAGARGSFVSRMRRSPQAGHKIVDEEKAALMLDME